MIKPNIVIVPQADGTTKAVKFYNLSVFEYWLGMKTEYLYQLLKRGWFPDSPYVREKNFPRPHTQRLYTDLMVEEAVELYENHYPVYYRGRDPLLREGYKRQIANYLEQVIALQNKWKEVDYVNLAPEAYVPRRKNVKPTS